MTTEDADRCLLAAIEDGLPLTSRPYDAVAATLRMAEAEVIARLGDLERSGVIRRLGLIVRHHEFGYRANAMAVWDVPDERADEIGRRIAALPFVTLCYRRPRRPPTWPYNLFCMIHGHDRSRVEALIGELSEACGLGGFAHAVLFSRRRFKQRGATFRAPLAGAA